MYLANTIFPRHIVDFLNLPTKLNRRAVAFSWNKILTLFLFFLDRLSLRFWGTPEVKGSIFAIGCALSPKILSDSLPSILCLPLGLRRKIYRGIGVFLQRISLYSLDPLSYKKEIKVALSVPYFLTDICDRKEESRQPEIKRPSLIWTQKRSIAQRGARTHDPEIKSLMLYRLS